MYDTNVRMKKKKHTHTDLDPWNCELYCRRRGKRDCGRCKSIKQDVCLRIGLSPHTAGRDEAVVQFTRRTRIVKFRQMFSKKCLSYFYQTLETVKISTAWSVDRGVVAQL